jgi:CHAT domain-containing protein
MLADLNELLEKSDKDLQKYVSAIPVDHVEQLFAQMWENIRRMQLFGGQARSAASIEATAFSQLALSVATFSNSETLTAEAHRMAAYVLNANEQYEEAIRHYTEAIILLDKTGALQKAARTRLGFLAALFMTGRYEQAIEEGRRADEWFLKSGDEDGHARLCVNFGNLYHRLDQHAEAVKYQNAAIKVFKRLKNSAALSPCFLNLGNSLSMLDRFDEADHNFEKAQKLSQKLNLAELHIQAKYNRAYLSFLRGRYSKAIEGFSELRDHYNSVGSLRHSALCDLDESEMYLHLNLSADALKLGKRAAEAFNQLGMKYEEAKARAFVAIGLTHVGQPTEALPVFLESQRIFEEEDNIYWAASVELYRAQVQYLAGRFWESRALAKTAHDRFVSLNIPSKRALALVLLARIALEVGETDEAVEHTAEIASIIQDTPIPLHLFPCYSITAQVAEYRKDLESAERFYQLAAQEIEIHRASLHDDELRVTFFKGKHQVYEALVRLAVRYKDPSRQVSEAYNWCERAKSRGLIDLLSQHLPAVHAQGHPVLLTRIQKLREQINSYYVRSGSEPRKNTAPDDTADLELKKSELAKNLKELANEDPEYVSLQKVSIVSVEQVQQALPSDSSVVEYFVARDEVLAFVISKHKASVQRHLCTFSRIRHLHERLRFQMDKFLLGSTYVKDFAIQLREATDKHLHELYIELIQPLAGILDCKHLIIVPHGILHYLPFHAFLDGTEYLIDRHTVSYAPSASILRYCIDREPVENASPLVVGVSDERAPQIADELSTLKKLMPHARIYSGRRATQRAVRREAARSDFLHIATHIVFRTDNPMFSSLKLFDGPLTALDLYSMRCQTNLVTLSGCSSGINDVGGADELLGLMRGFLYAGARSLMVSLWDVDDRATSTFMRTFYQAWLRGQSKAEAVQHAAREVRAEEPHPHFWAPFYLVGKP